MVVTGRLAAAAGVAALFVTLVLPSSAGVAVVTCVLVAGLLIDLGAVGRARDLALSREALTTVRLGRSAEVELVAVNTGAQVLRGTVWTTGPTARAPSTGRTGSTSPLAPRSDSAPRSPPPTVAIESRARSRCDCSARSDWRGGRPGASCPHESARCPHSAPNGCCARK
ncbi:hypothetical protein [Nocardia sp. CY41]|uniref:hypothetical protein n=1 Tax=Nocardia sp. CY41 TaxID=2608686 RepID=UPI001F27D525|nr:hypothetical protein [Nocardia sp. CY41]